MQSKFFTEKLLNQLEVPEDEADALARDNGSLRITETMVLQDSRDPKESLANISFTFKTPVKDNPSVTEKLVDNVQAAIISGDLDVMNRILQAMGMQPQSRGVKKTQVISTNIGKYSRYRGQKSDPGLRDGRGRFVSEINLRNALKLATISNVVAEMKSPGTSGLVYRTGRLQYSVDLKPLVLKNNTLSVFFTYMVRPYSVFDPQVSRYRGLSSSARNPQKLITEQLQKQAAQLGLSRYKIDIKQHWRR